MKKLNKTGQRGGFKLWLLLLIVIVVALFVDANRQLHAPLKLTQATRFEIGSGERLLDVLQNLHSRQLLSLRQMLYLRLYARMGGKAKRIKAGEYQVQPRTNALQLLRQIIAGRVMLHEIRLIEGWRLSQALQVIAADPNIHHTLPAKADGSAVMAAIGHPGEPAEGHFFPDTYRFPLHESDVEFLRRAYDEMQQRLQAAWATRAPDLPLKNAEDALILASLVEKETAKESERPQIAGVFIRRLKIGMRLQTDPTVIYGMGAAYDGNIRSKDLTHDTPYNTYTRGGLPPTPICLPGEASLKAAVHPDDGKSLYFVSRGDGSHAFSDTLEAHDANVRRYQLGDK